MKKWLLGAVAAVSLALGACSQSEVEESKAAQEVNLGIQQTLSPLWVAREKGWLDEAFEEVGVDIKWTEFQSGPPQFEGIAAGKLDITEVGNTPPLTGQAANIAFKEVALILSGQTNNAVLLPKDSPIQSLKELEGKKIAVAKGSSAFGLLYTAFEKEGVDPSKVEVIQLQPDEAQPAFENGSVDAWVIWEPFVSYQTVKNDAKPLLKGIDIGAQSSSFTIAREGFTEESPELVELYLEVYKKASDWVQENPKEAVQFFADLKGIEPEIVTEVLKNAPYELQVISNEVVESQQKVADLFVKHAVFEQPIDVEAVIDNQFIERVLENK